MFSAVTRHQGCIVTRCSALGTRHSALVNVASGIACPHRDFDRRKSDDYLHECRVPSAESRLSRAPSHDLAECRVTTNLNIFPHNTCRDDSMTKVAFLGLGAIGRPMAKHLAK